MVPGAQLIPELIRRREPGRARLLRAIRKQENHALAQRKKVRQTAIGMMHKNFACGGGVATFLRRAGLPGLGSPEDDTAGFPAFDESHLTDAGLKALLRQRENDHRDWERLVTDYALSRYWNGALGEDALRWGFRHAGYSLMIPGWKIPKPTRMISP